MKVVRLIPFLLIAITLVFSCKKEDLPLDNLPGNTDTIDKPFDNIPATEDIVMYEVNLRAFSNSGDLQGVISRLDEIKFLGVNVIWLMPIYPIGDINSVNSPYCVKDYKAVDAEFGSLDDLKLLVKEAHKKNMAVILDWVGNHTAWDNNWIQHKDWYTQDGSGNIIPPEGTNWLDVADLNYDNQEMRQQMIAAMKYWILEANIDGYRCDFADGIPFDFWRQSLDTLNAIPGRNLIFLAEGGRSDHYSAGFQMTYGWDFYSTITNVYQGDAAFKLIGAHNGEYLNVPNGKHKLRYTTNHDESAWNATPIELFNGKSGALSASVATIFLSGVPLIYSSQEVGREETLPFFSNSHIDWSVNADMLAAYQLALDFYSYSSVARIGTITFYPNADVFCFKKELNNDEIVVVVNVRNSQQLFDLPNELQNTSWIDAILGSPVTLEAQLNLAPYQFFILR